jgi:predicted RNA-binding protein with PUA-like domain
MNHWLMKTEPDVFSIDDLAARNSEPWNGVRNYQARNHLRAMRVGDRVLIYHSNAKPSGIAGIAEVCRAAYPDHTAWDPSAEYFDPKATPENDRWSMVDVRFIAKFSRFLALDELRADPFLSGMVLFRASRLSVQPVDATHFAHLVRCASAR